MKRGRRGPGGPGGPPGKAWSSARKLGLGRGHGGGGVARTRTREEAPQKETQNVSQKAYTKLGGVLHSKTSIKINFVSLCFCVCEFWGVGFGGLFEPLFVGPLLDTAGAALAIGRARG